MTVEGKALKYGDNIDTDVIFPGKNLVLSKPEEIASHAMEGLDPDFSRKIKDYGIIVARQNFGCGSSREHAPLALKYAGVKCIIAESFARIFFRNAINIGLPVIECKGIHSKISEGDRLKVFFEKGIIKNLTRNEAYDVTPLPEFLMKILRCGGLIEYINQQYFSSSSCELLD